MKSAGSVVLLFVLIMAIQFEFKSCVARDAITYNTMLPSEETLVSAGKRFELGFFNPDQDNVNNGGTFLGIWYYNLSPRTVVWVANRNASLLQISGYLAITDDGNLKLLDSNGISYFHTNLEKSTAVNKTLCRLLDSGNLALIDDQTGEYLWQSFSEPTDTFLPGMKMNASLKLVSWMDPSSPAKGNYTFQEDQADSKLMVMKRAIIYWRSDVSDSSELPSFLTFFLSNFSESTYPSNRKFNYSNTRLLMNYSGEIQFYILDEEDNWSLIWSEPQYACSVFKPCGKFGMCNPINGRPRCECLPGFDPVSPDNWERGDFGNGCERKDPICNDNSKPDKFLNLKLASVQKPNSPFIEVDSEENCKGECLGDCQTQCEAYYYEGRKRGEEKGPCWIWTSDLNNLLQNSVSGHDLCIRVSASAIESTSRDCEPCGKYVIPYPLSSGYTCGDPSYDSFSCYNSTGQLSFLTMNNSYEVININGTKRRFVIELNSQTDNCSSRTSVLEFNKSSPFDVTKSCYSIEQLNLTDGLSKQGRPRIEIGWKPPLEPICNSSSDCKDWPNSNCSTVSQRCLCNSNYRWDGQALNCTTVVLLSVPVSVVANTKHSKEVIIGTTITAAVLLTATISCFFYRRRRILAKGRGEERVSENPVHRLYDNERDVEDLVDEDNNIVDLTYFSLESILEATENFADAHKLGQGGFGPVYKGTFPGGKEIAVKRLSSHSVQGMEEFRNEVVLIAKLQHRNLVRLLGYCIKGSEKLLLYEYMPNKSLDSFIFDQGRSILLDWEMRFDIILGIARGLLYLHQDSRLRIIHRDLKTSNILLDEDMNPKISDFGLARIFSGKETEANTMRVVGTYGYMSPEYAQAGFYSVKSDVFSFGVIVLEIISGKRNTGFYQSEEALSLLGYAWRLWEERNAINLVDKRILQSCNGTEVMKCINIGLLCAQEDPSDRPTMSNVMIMLGGEVTTLPSPKEPGFVSGKRTSSTSTSSSRQAEIHSVNKMSNTFQEGR